ncbi:hypothetical protein FGO68_gene10697 [Halteria grandinella]|uniref:Uncharacterized protein n=1 Tax=Halteria grandinella TaxID=5974 RepID=A0A8J8NVZ5_HALGN|nr:hypothetical protein FGO68_gene10697 [Halteria grandinella]
MYVNIWNLKEIVQLIYVDEVIGTLNGIDILVSHFMFPKDDRFDETMKLRTFWLANHYILKIRGKEALIQFKNEILKESFEQYIQTIPMNRNTEIEKIFLQTVSKWCGSKNVSLVQRINCVEGSEMLEHDKDTKLNYCRCRLDFDVFECNKEVEKRTARVFSLANERSRKNSEFSIDINAAVEYMRKNELPFQNINLNIRLLPQLSVDPIVKQRVVQKITFVNYVANETMNYMLKLLQSFPRIKKLQINLIEFLPEEIKEGYILEQDKYSFGKNQQLRSKNCTSLYLPHQQFMGFPSQT